MSVKIRLSRVGAKKQPTYRIVVADESSKRDGRLVERLGHYDPRTEPATIVLNEERTRYWLSVGARPTDAMGIILRSAGISDKFVRERAARKSKHVLSTAEGSAQAEAPAQPATPPGQAPAAETPSS